MADILPKWLMIGAPRTGSTALNDALEQHPDFFLARGKETHFFSYDGDASVPPMRALNIPYRGVRTLAEYRENFEGGAAFSHPGEIDPSILKAAPYAVPKIRETLGTNIPMLVVLRHPVERAYSNYLLHCRVGSESAPFAPYVYVETPRTPQEFIAVDRYFGFSLYAASLQLFFETFGRAQFLILLYDDLKADPQAYMRRILEFLNADTRIIPTLSPETNAGGMMSEFQGQFNHPEHPARRFARACLPLSLRGVIRKSFGWKSSGSEFFVKPDLDPELRAALMPRFRDDILRTQDLIQRDLSHWLQ